jgi:hypothetical protein
MKKTKPRWFAVYFAVLDADLEYTKTAEKDFIKHK